MQQYMKFIKNNCSFWDVKTLRRLNVKLIEDCWIYYEMSKNKKF